MLMGILVYPKCPVREISSLVRRHEEIFVEAVRELFLFDVSR